MSKEYKYYKRGFLNKKQGRAIFEAEMEADSYSVCASFSISDCNRQITLDFSFYSDKEFKNKMEKIQLLQRELYIMEQEMQKGYDHYKALKDAK